MGSPELVHSPPLSAHNVSRRSVLPNSAGFVTDTLPSTQLEQTPVVQGKLVSHSLFAEGEENSPQGGRVSIGTLSPTHVSATQWSHTDSTHYGLFTLPPTLATEVGPSPTNTDEIKHSYRPDLTNKEGESLVREIYRVDPEEREVVIPETQLPEPAAFHWEDMVDSLGLSDVALELDDEPEREPTAVSMRTGALDRQRGETHSPVIPETQYPVEGRSLTWDDVPETPLPAAALVQASRLATPVSSLKKLANISNYADHPSTPVRRLVRFGTHSPSTSVSNMQQLKLSSKDNSYQVLSHTIIPETQYTEIEGSLEFERSEKSACDEYSCDLYCTETQRGAGDELELPTLQSGIDGPPVVSNPKSSSDQGVEHNRRIDESEVGQLHHGIKVPQAQQEGDGQQYGSRAFPDSLDLYHTVYDLTQVAPHDDGEVQPIPTLFQAPSITPLNSMKPHPASCTMNCPGSPCLADSPDLMSTCRNSVYGLGDYYPGLAPLTSPTFEPLQGDLNVMYDEPGQHKAPHKQLMAQGVNCELDNTVVNEESVELGTMTDETQESIMLPLPRELFNSLVSQQNTASTTSVLSPITASVTQVNDNVTHTTANRVTRIEKKSNNNNPTEDTPLRRNVAQVNDTENLPTTTVETLSKSFVAITLNTDASPQGESTTSPPIRTSTMENQAALESPPARSIRMDSPATNASETLSECITRRSRVRRKVKLTTPVAYPDWDVNHEISPTRVPCLSTMVTQTQTRVHSAMVPPQTPVTPRVRRCHHCGTTDSKQWRKGPQGLRSLCNPCGLWYAVHRQLPILSPEGTPSLRPSKQVDNSTPTVNSRQLDSKDTSEHHNPMDGNIRNIEHESCPDATLPISIDKHMSDIMQNAPGSTTEHETDAIVISKIERSSGLPTVCPHCKQCMVNEGRKARSKGKKKSAAKSTRLAPQAATRSSIFSSFLFIVTYPPGVSPRDVLGREQVESLVHTHGGQLIDSETEFVQLVRTMYPVPSEVSDYQGWTSRANINPCQFPNDIAPKIIVISVVPRRTLKYLLALALGIPCVDARWLQASVDAGNSVALQDYLLPAGSSLFTQRELYPVTYRTLATHAGAPNHTHILSPMRPVFQNLRVYIDGSVAFRKNWTRVIGEAAGAWVLTRRQMEAHKSRRVTQVLTDTEATELTWCDLVLCEKSPTRLLRRLASVTRSRLQTVYKTGVDNDVTCLPSEVAGLTIGGEWQQSVDSTLRDGATFTENEDNSFSATSLSPPLVSSEWVVQCLTHQNLLHWDAHPAFTQWQD
ncbi:hypothetical protein IWQ61_006992 [Dispira simplex]|nr:hypothetical protein IWQ61_006992 [Dispira simplex]